MADLVAKLDLTGLPEVKALYDAATSAVALLGGARGSEEIDQGALQARKLLVDALIAFRES